MSADYHTWPSPKLDIEDLITRIMSVHITIKGIRKGVTYTFSKFEEQIEKPLITANCDVVDILRTCESTDTSAKPAGRCSIHRYNELLCQIRSANAAYVTFAKLHYERNAGRYANLDRTEPNLLRGMIELLEQRITDRARASKQVQEMTKLKAELAEQKASAGALQVAAKAMIHDAEVASAKAHAVEVKRLESEVDVLKKKEEAGRVAGLGPSKQNEEVLAEIRALIKEELADMRKLMTAERSASETVEGGVMGSISALSKEQRSLAAEIIWEAKDKAIQLIDDHAAGQLRIIEGKADQLDSVMLAFEKRLSVIPPKPSSPVSPAVGSPASNGSFLAVSDAKDK